MVGDKIKGKIVSAFGDRSAESGFIIMVVVLLGGEAVFFLLLIS